MGSELQQQFTELYFFDQNISLRDCNIMTQMEDTEEKINKKQDILLGYWRKHKVQKQAKWNPKQSQEYTR